MSADPCPTTTNFHQAELDHFGALAQGWWDPQGPQQPLHVLNPLRCDFLAKYQPLGGAKILDVGCGGGLLSETMAMRGAHVVGIDLAQPLIAIAQEHCAKTPGLTIDYRQQSVESVAEEMPEYFDTVACMEMLEHVPDPQAIIAACVACLKPGGWLVMSTINRTRQAFALAIVGAEYIARLLPPKTHRYQQFIKPSELAGWLRTMGMSLQEVMGVRYWPWISVAIPSQDPSVNYLLCAQKPRIEEG